MASKAVAQAVKYTKNKNRELNCLICAPQRDNFLRYLKMRFSLRLLVSAPVSFRLAQGSSKQRRWRQGGEDVVARGQLLERHTDKNRPGRSPSRDILPTITPMLLVPPTPSQGHTHTRTPCYAWFFSSQSSLVSAAPLGRLPR